MRSIPAVVVALAVAATTVVVAQGPAQGQGQGQAQGRGQGRGRGPAVPLLPPPAALIAPGAGVEKLAGDFLFTEGPTVDAEGNVYFVDQDNNRIHKYSVEGELTTFLEPSGRANGMSFDNDGRLIAAADERNELWAIDVATKAHTVLVGAQDGKYLNGPNDIWVQPGPGRIYFTDPYYRRDWWQHREGPSELPQVVYMYTPADQSLTVVADDLVQPNGIVGTPDGQTLYIADIRGRQTYAYDIAADGTLTNKRPFAASGSDGMTIDAEGNLYLSSRGVQVFDNTGQHIGTIEVPEGPANLVFGGADRQTLFITARTGLYAIRMAVKGGGPQ